MPKLLFIGGTHGNEEIGVEALTEIELIYDRQEYNYDWIKGNPRALELGERFIDTDLNRSAPGDPISSLYEERRAAEIVQLSKNYDAVIDIHGTVADCGIVTIIADPTLENMDLAKRIPVARNVVWYSKKSIPRGPLTQYTKCPAVEIECGPKSSKNIQDELKQVIGQILVRNLGTACPKPIANQEFFDIQGRQTGDWDDNIRDFEQTTLKGETFFPFLSAQYPGLVCYKMQKISPGGAASTNDA